MGLSLGNAHAELQPQDKAAMQESIQQLKSLVGMRSIEAQMRAGRSLQQEYARRKVLERRAVSETGDPTLLYSSRPVLSSRASSPRALSSLVENMFILLGSPVAVLDLREHRYP